MCDEAKTVIDDSTLVADDEETGDGSDEDSDEVAPSPLPGNN